MPYKPNKTSFKYDNRKAKGHGRPKISAELRAIQNISADNLTRIISKYFKMGLTEFDKARLNPEIARIDAYVTNIIHRAITDSDPQIARDLLDRMVGKVKEVVTVDITRDDEVDEALRDVPEKNVIAYLRSTIRVA